MHGLFIYRKRLSHHRLRSTFVAIVFTVKCKLKAFFCFVDGHKRPFSVDRGSERERMKTIEILSDHTQTHTSSVAGVHPKEKQRRMGNKINEKAFCDHIKVKLTPNGAHSNTYTHIHMHTHSRAQIIPKMSI